MRLVTWNCRVGGFRRKARFIAPLRPDLLSVQECEPLDEELLLDGDSQPTFRDRLSRDACPGRGVAMLSYGELRIARVPDTDHLQGFRMFEVSGRGLSFNAVAAWTWEMKLRSSSYRQAHEGLTLNEAWVRARPTVLMGDLNGNGAFKSQNWPDFLALADRFQLVSAYHAFFGEPFGGETRPTHFFRGKQDAPFHLDYCFIPAAWTQGILNVEIGHYDQWRHLSDHAPVIVDLDETLIGAAV